MVLITDEYVTVVPCRHDILWGVPFPLECQTIQGLEQSSYHGLLFLTEIRKNNKYGTLGKMLPVKPSKLHNLPNNNQTYMWCQDDIDLAYYSLARSFQFGTKVRKKLKYLHIIK